MSAKPFLYFVALTTLLLGFYAPQTKAAKPEVFTGIVRGVAVGGYDPVAYFNQGKPVKGSAAVTLKHAGATWRFATEANRDAFKADPDKYAPRYGGYCAWAVSQGYTAKGDPRSWKIVNGRLYLNYNADVQKTWEKSAPKLIRKGDANWPRVLNK
jgi:YHS domain-containing protein